MALTGKTRYRTWWLGKQILQVEEVFANYSSYCPPPPGCKEPEKWVCREEVYRWTEWRDATAEDWQELAAIKGKHESAGAFTVKVDVDSKDAKAEIAELTAMAKQLSRELEQLNRIGVPIGGARVEAK